MLVPVPGPDGPDGAARPPARRPAPYPDRAAPRWVTCFHRTAVIVGRWAGGFAAARTAAEADQRSRLRHGNFRDHARGSEDPTASGPWPSRTPRMVGVTRRRTIPFRVPATDRRVVRGVSPAHPCGLQPGTGQPAQALTPLRHTQAGTACDYGSVRWDPPTARAGFCQARSEAGHRLQNRSGHRG